MAADKIIRNSKLDTFLSKLATKLAAIFWRKEETTQVSIDDTPTANSNNLVKSGGVKAYVDNAIPDAVEANPTVPSGTTPTTLQNVKVGDDYYSVPNPTVPDDLDDLSDVNLGTPSDGNVLTYDSTTGKWVATEPQGSGDAVLYTQQTLTDAQKIQARENQGLYAGVEEDAGIIEWNGSTSGRDTFLFQNTTFYKVSDKNIHYTCLESLADTTSIGRSIQPKDIFLYNDSTAAVDNPNISNLVLIRDYQGNPAVLVLNGLFDYDENDYIYGLYFASHIRELVYSHSATEVTKTIYNGFIPKAEFITNKVSSIDSSTTYSAIQYPNVNAVKQYVYYEVHPQSESSIPVGGLQPGILYNLSVLTGSVTIDLATPADANVANEYAFTFTAGSTVPEISWPASIIGWGGNCLDTNGQPKFVAGNIYEVSIRNNIGAIMEVDLSEY